MGREYTAVYYDSHIVIRLGVSILGVGASDNPNLNPNRNPNRNPNPKDRGEHIGSRSV
jgi:hypothetical protein